MIKFILGKVGGPFLVYALMATLATSVLGVGAAKYYRNKAQLAVAQCDVDKERAAREAEEAVGRRLKEAYEEAIKLEKERAENERRAAERAKILIAEIERDKLKTERRLREALKNKDTLDWANTPVPSGLLTDPDDT